MASYSDLSISVRCDLLLKHWSYSSKQHSPINHGTLFSLPNEAQCLHFGVTTTSISQLHHATQPQCYLNKVVIRSIQVFVKLNHKTLEEWRELALHFPRIIHLRILQIPHTVAQIELRFCPNRREIGHFVDVLPSKSLRLVLKTKCNTIKASMHP